LGRGVGGQVAANPTPKGSPRPQRPAPSAEIPVPERHRRIAQSWKSAVIGGSFRSVAAQEFVTKKGRARIRVRPRWLAYLRLSQRLRLTARGGFGSELNSVVRLLRIAVNPCALTTNAAGAAAFSLVVWLGAQVIRGKPQIGASSSVTTAVTICKGMGDIFL